MIDKENKNVSVSAICFHDPYWRLQLRSRVEEILVEVREMDQRVDMDITCVIDALMKRGGYEDGMKRIDEIILSLNYYDSEVVRGWCQEIKGRYWEIVERLPVVRVRGQSFIEQHLLPGVDLRDNVQGKILEMSFYRSNFSCLDEYLNIKTLAYFGGDLSRIPKKYYTKYFMLRKFLFVNDFIPKLSVLDERILQEISPVNSSKICIVGFSIANIILGIKLSRMNLNVTIYPTSREILQKWENGNIPDLLQEGIFSCNEYEMNQIKELLGFYLDVQIKICQNRKDFGRGRKMERNVCILIYLINEILSQCPGNNGKSVWMEIQNKIGVINLGGFDEGKGEERLNVQGIRLLFDEFLVLNHIKNDGISVGELKRYLKKSGEMNMSFYQCSKMDVRQGQQGLLGNGTKGLMNFEYYYLPNRDYRNMKFELMLNGSIGRLQISKKIFVEGEYLKNNWQVLVEDERGRQRENYDYMIYGDQEQIQRTIRNKNSFIGCVKGENLHLLRSQLQVSSYLYFMFNFDGIVEFKNECGVCSYNSGDIGIVHYFLLEGCNSVIGCVRGKYYERQRMDEKVQGILFDEVLKNRNYVLCRVSTQVNDKIKCEISREFHIKQSSVLMSIIKPNSGNRLFISIPIFCCQGPCNRISSQLWINCKIFAQIMKELQINVEIDINQCIDKILFGQNVKKIENDKNVIENDNGQFGFKKENKINQSHKSFENIHVGSNYDCHNFCNVSNDNNSTIKSQMAKSLQNLDSKQEVSVPNHLAQESLKQVSQITSQMDLFGFSSEIVQAIKQSFKLSLNNSCVQPLPQILFSVPIPLPFQEPLYLCNSGFPMYISMNLYLIHYLSVRISSSLSNPFGRSYFYQTCIIFKEIPVYCLVQREMGNQTDQIFLFHTNYNKLMREVNVLQKSGKISINIEEEEEMKIEEHPVLLSSILINKIRNQLTDDLGIHKDFNDQNCSQILNRKLEQIKNLRKKAENGEKVNRPQKPVNFTCQTFQDNIGQLIFDQIQEQTKFYTKLYGLKDYGFEDIFMGKLNPIFIQNEMKGSFEVDFQKTKEEDGDDTQFVFNYLLQINREQKYPLEIVKNIESTSIFTIHRKFISPTSAFHYEISSYSFPISLSAISPHMPSPTRNLLPILLTTLALRTRNIYLIMTQLKYLLHQQLNMAIKMVNLCKSSQDYQRKMGIYFKSTRMANIQQVSEDMAKQKFEIMGMLRNYEGGESTGDGQKWEQIQEMVNEGNIFLCADEAIFVNQYL